MHISHIFLKQTKMCLGNINAPIMANSKGGIGHKDKYLDTSTKMLLQEMFMCNMKADIS